jgi:hypothetical protein
MFDCRLAHSRVLNELMADGVQFITLRRRSQGLLKKAAALPDSAWPRVSLSLPKRKHKTSRVSESEVTPVNVHRLITRPGLPRDFLIGRVSPGLRPRLDGGRDGPWLSAAQARHSLRFAPLTPRWLGGREQVPGSGFGCSCASFSSRHRLLASARRHSGNHNASREASSS